MHKNEKVILFALPINAKPIVYLKKQLQKFYEILETSNIEDISKSSFLRPLAIFFSIDCIEFPTSSWMEKIHFLSDCNNFIVLGNIENLPTDSKKQYMKSLESGTFCHLNELAIFQNHFHFILSKATQENIVDKELVDLKNILGTDTKLHLELDLRSKALKREKEFNTKVIESITSALVVIDNENCIVAINQEAIKIANIHQKDYFAVHYQDVFSPRISDTFKKIIEVTLKTKSRQTIDKLTFNYSMYLSWSCSPIIDRNVILGTLHLIDDITEIQTTERQLFQAEKLATIGTMLSGVAHEIRNPLSIISGRAELILTKENQYDKTLIKHIKSIEQQAIRCATILNNLLNLSRKDTVGFKNNSINNILEEALIYVHYQKNLNEITVIKKLTTEDDINCDRQQMLQVFINLISNAIDAMDGKGEIVLETKALGKYLYIGIEDSGEGIEDKNLNKIFDPFFTTKEAGKGTGLGLPITYRIIQQHSGTIKPTSYDGKTIFKINIPTRI